MQPVDMSGSNQITFKNFCNWHTFMGNKMSIFWKERELSPTGGKKKGMTTKCHIPELDSAPEIGSE